MADTYRAWMIDTGEGSYLGRYGIFPVAHHTECHQFAAWNTGAEARAELPRVRSSFPRAAVRRVEITVHLEERDDDGK